MFQISIYLGMNSKSNLNLNIRYIHFSPNLMQEYIWHMVYIEKNQKDTVSQHYTELANIEVWLSPYIWASLPYAIAGCTLHA